MSLRKNLKIHFIVPYPHGLAPGQRFRFEQYLDALKENGFLVKLSPFLSIKDYSVLYAKGHTLQKIIGVIKGFVKRFLILVVIAKADFIFIFREAAPVGPPIFEWIIAKILRKKIIYDFDDAIWLTDRKDESPLLKFIKWRTKVALICRWSYKVSCGNEYLCDYAKRFNKNVILNPTTIDTESLHNPTLYGKKLSPSAVEKVDAMIIGWTGSHSTLKYLVDLEPVLQNLEMKYPKIQFWVISNVPPAIKLKNLHFKPWSLESEIRDLAQLHIGLMPLPNDEWSMGKCGFKALQYMSLGIPAVASPVGVNNKIIVHGENGYLANDSDWEKLITMLIEDATLRKQIGENGKMTVEKSFSVHSNTKNFLALFS